MPVVDKLVAWKRRHNSDESNKAKESTNQLTRFSSEYKNDVLSSGLRVRFKEQLRDAMRRAVVRKKQGDVLGSIEILRTDTQSLLIFEKNTYTASKTNDDYKCAMRALLACLEVYKGESDEDEFTTDICDEATRLEIVKYMKTLKTFQKPVEPETSDEEEAVEATHVMTALHVAQTVGQFKTQRLKTMQKYRGMKADIQSVIGKMQFHALDTTVDLARKNKAMLRKYWLQWQAGIRVYRTLKRIFQLHVDSVHKDQLHQMGKKFRTWYLKTRRTFHIRDIGGKRILMENDKHYCGAVCSHKSHAYKHGLGDKGWKYMTYLGKAVEKHEDSKEDLRDDISFSAESIDELFSARSSSTVVTIPNIEMPLDSCLPLREAQKWKKWNEDGIAHIDRDAIRAIANETEDVPTEFYSSMIMELQAMRAQRAKNRRPLLSDTADNSNTVK